MERPYLHLIQDAGSAVGVSFDVIEPGMVYRISNNQRQYLMYNVDPGLNDSAALQIANSKSATFSVLKAAETPAVQHYFLLNESSKYSSTNIREVAATWFNQFNKLAVVKRDDGLKGNYVYKVTSPDELNTALDQIYTLGFDAAISPFYVCEYEYRIVMLANTPKLIFGKKRTNSWKHNLNQGALVTSVDEVLKSSLEQIAIAATKALGLQFCTVDILDTPIGLRVLEINSNVFLGELLSQKPEYKENIHCLFKEVFTLKFKMH